MKSWKEVQTFSFHEPVQATTGPFQHTTGLEINFSQAPFKSGYSQIQESAWTSNADCGNCKYGLFTFLYHKSYAGHLIEDCISHLDDPSPHSGHKILQTAPRVIF